jgi:cyclic beta-1,2-glucan synthetase
MTLEPITIDDSPAGNVADADQQQWHEAGAALGRAHRETMPRGRARSTPPNRRRRVKDLIDRAASHAERDKAKWVLDNFRLILSAEKEGREFALTARQLRVVRDPSGAETPVVCLVARSYLQAGGYALSEQGLSAFLQGYQETAELEIGEVWALRPALQLELLDRLTEAGADEWPVLLTSLRRIGETTWKDLFEAVSRAHALLARDPAGAYSRMDFESRERYRKALADLAKHGPLT